MASTSPTSGLQVSGLASGLDTSSIIQQLMSVESKGKVRLQQQQTIVSAHQTALGSIRTKLSAVSNAAAALRDTALFAPVSNVDVSDPTKVAAVRVSGAGAGGYALTVSTLARAEQRTYAYTAQSSLSTITAGGHSTNIAANASVDDVVQSVNGDTSAAVYAANVNGKLVLSSRQTGSANGFTATGASVVEDPTQAKPGQDAHYNVDGVDGTSGSNVLTDAIPGLKLTLRSTFADPVTVNVGAATPDLTAIKGKVKAFVDAYNTAIDSIRGPLTQDRVTNPTTDSQRVQGMLRGDIQLQDLLDQMRTGVGALTAIGVSTGTTTGGGTIDQGSVTGHLQIDDVALTNALQTNPTSVQNMLGAATGVSGWSQSFKTVLDPQLQAGGIFDARNTSDSSRLKDLTNSISSMDERLALRQQVLQQQFTNLETVMGNAQSQGSWLSSQIAAL